MGVLPDLAAPDGGHGGVHAAVLRRPGGAPLRPLHRRLRLVLLSLHHHPRPRRHLDDDASRRWGHFILLELVILEYIFTDLGCSSSNSGV